MSILKSFFKSRDKPNNHIGDNIGGGRFFAFGRSWAGKNVTERSAMQTTAVYGGADIFLDSERSRNKCIQKSRKKLL